MKKLCLVLAVLFIINIGLTSCDIKKTLNVGQKQGNTLSETKTDDGDVMDSGPVSGGVLKLFSTVPDTLNPVLTKNVYVRDFSEFIFDSLILLDKDQKPIPELADKWEVSTDGLTWTFYIRSNINWQDGTPLTAEDAEFTIETILNTKVDSVYKKNLENIAAFTAIDRNILKIILKKPNSFTAESMTFPVISKHYFNGEDLSKTPKNMAPMGTGPYKFLSYDGKSVVKLSLNKNWWKNSLESSKKEQVLPYIEEIDVMLYKSSRDALSAFQTRDIDVTFVKSGDFSKYNGRSDLSLKKYPGRDYDFIALNLTNPILSDKVVRQALSYAIDKVKIINNIFPGEAVAADIPVMPDTWLYNSDIASYSPDSTKARELLFQNGWKENKDTGELYKNIFGVTRTLTLEILVNEDNDLRCKIAEEISKQLLAAGIKLNIAKVKWDDEFKKIGTKKYDMALMGWNVPSTSDISFAYSSSAIDAGTNISGYKNPDVDNYLKQILEENDDTRKKALFFNMRSLINDDVPYIGLFFYNNAVLVNKRVKGDINPYFWNKYNGFEKWYIPVKD